MAVSMDNVDAISIPEGDVLKIDDKTNDLWYKAQYEDIDLFTLCIDGIGWWNHTWTSCAGYGTDNNWIWSAWIPVGEGKIVYNAYLHSSVGHFTAWSANGALLGEKTGTTSGAMASGVWVLPQGTQYLRINLCNPDSTIGQRYNQSARFIGKSPLPSRYQRLYSIISTRSGQTGQYVDTGILPKSNHVIDITTTPINVSGDECLFGMSAMAGTFLGTIHSHWRIGRGLRESAIDVHATKTRAQAQGSTWKIGNDTDNNATAIADGTKTYLVFGCQYNNTSRPVLYGSFAVHQVVISEQQNASYQFVGSVPKCYLLPCRDLSTNELGMFDVVARAFRGNLGSGEFTTSPWDSVIYNRGKDIAVGDELVLDLGTIDGINCGSVRMQKVAANEANAVSIFMAKDFLATAMKINSTNTVNGGWGDCELRAWLNDAFLKALPHGLSGAIVPMTRYSRIYNADTGQFTADVAFVDKIWIPSVRELNGGGGGAGSLGPTYKSFYPTAASRVKTLGIGGSTYRTWLRDVSSTSYFYGNAANGNAGTGATPTTLGGITLCFGI